MLRSVVRASSAPYVALAAMLASATALAEPVGAVHCWSATFAAFVGTVLGLPAALACAGVEYAFRDRAPPPVLAYVAAPLGLAMLAAGVDADATTRVPALLAALTFGGPLVVYAARYFAPVPLLRVLLLAGMGFAIYVAATRHQGELVPRCAQEDGGFFTGAAATIGALWALAWFLASRASPADDATERALRNARVAAAASARARAVAPPDRDDAPPAS